MTVGDLCITVHNGENLHHASSSFTRPQTYVKLTLGSRSHKTSTQTDAAHPRFEQTFTFPLTRTESYLQCEVKLTGLFGSSLSSSAQLPVDDLLRDGVHTVVLHSAASLDNSVDVGRLVISSHFTSSQSQPQQTSMYPGVGTQPPPAFNPSYEPAPGEAPPSYESIAYQQPHSLPSSAFDASKGPYASPPPSQPQSQSYYQQPPPQQSYPSTLPQQPVYAHPAPQPQQAFQSWSPAQSPQGMIAVQPPPFGTGVRLRGHPHPLIHQRHVYRGEYQCNNCRVERRGPVFHCEVDNFDLCPSCFVTMSQPNMQSVPVMAPPHAQPVHAYRDVRHPHLLTLQPVYVNNANPGRYRCDACQQPGCGEAFHCNSCQFDLHPQCFRQS